MVAAAAVPSGGPAGQADADFRTDVLVGPTIAMWEAMRRAEVGWAPIGEDRSVRELESTVAELLGKQAGLFVPTCGAANLIALMTLGQRGSRAVVPAQAHVLLYEEYGLSDICGLVPLALPVTEGVFDPADLENALAESELLGLPPTSVVCLENSHNASGGGVITEAQSRIIGEIAHRHGAAIHLDGARIFNAAAALGVPVRQLAACADTVAVSLNKGLGAPYGAVLVGAQGPIADARRHARRIGALSVHQAGIFAAAALVALRTAGQRFAEDNGRAATLAAGLRDVSGESLRVGAARTNIVIADIDESLGTAEAFTRRLADQRVYVLPWGRRSLRFVTHGQIADSHVERAVDVMSELVASRPKSGEGRVVKGSI
jgi:threonine aldolase